MVGTLAKEGVDESVIFGGFYPFFGDFYPLFGVFEGVDESVVRKLQIGGPDGDLGSNEILISKDVTLKCTKYALKMH